MTDAPGTYALLLRANNERTVNVGALGGMTVRSGVYVYVGSALGPGGVRARVQRHAQNEGATHWHVDYLRAVTALTAAWITYDDTRRECTWASAVWSLAGGTVPMTGFGASDCDCPAHLFRFEEAPSVSAFRSCLRSHCPHHEEVLRIPFS